MKCNRKNCGHYFEYKTNERTCHQFEDPEICADFTQNFIFDLEWIPLTDEEKPGHFESVLFLIKHDHGIDFEKGDYNKESEIWSHRKTRHYSKPKATHWARITLPDNTNEKEKEK